MELTTSTRSEYIAGNKRLLPLMKFIFCLTSLTYIALPAHASSVTLQPIIEKALTSEGLQGAVWSTVDADGTVSIGAGGTRNALTKARMRPDDRVHVGSVAKTLLAVGVLRLVSQGRLSLSTQVSTLLADVKFDNEWDATDPVRLRHLLDHTSGLDDARLSQVFSLKATPDTPLADSFTRSASRLRVRSRPGAHSSYSNSGYTLLGRVIEAVTHERYETYLNAKLLQPLGMHDSTFSYVTQIGPTADPRLAMGHFENGAAQAAIPLYLRPAGQFTTTAADMATLARFLMGDGSINGSPYIATSLLRAMGRPVETEAANAGLHIGFSLGLGTRDRHGALGKCHGGSTIGFKAMFCLFPDQHKAFFIATNADSETANYGRFDALMVKALALTPLTVAQGSHPAFNLSDWEGYYIPAPNRFARFAWLDTVLNFARLHKVEGKVRFTPFQASTVALEHVDGALFRAAGRVSASHVLISARTGERILSTGTQSYQKVSLASLIPKWASLLFGMLGLAYIVAAGFVKVATRTLSADQPLSLPFAGVTALLLPVSLFCTQSYLALGDTTIASATLAMVTALLPVTMLAGLVRGIRHWPTSRFDIVAMLGVLQLTVVLAAWGLVPLRLWA